MEKEYKNKIKQIVEEIKVYDLSGVFQYYNSLEKENQEKLMKALEFIFKDE